MKDLGVQEDKNMDKLLTVKDISAILCIGKTNTYKLVQKKDFPKITIGKKILVRQKDLDSYLTKYLKATINL